MVASELFVSHGHPRYAAERQRGAKLWHYRPSSVNIANTDFRDSLGAIARLAYAAKQCELELAEYTVAICPDLSPKLMERIRKPGPVNVGPDADGNLVFKRTAEAEARHAQWKEFIKAHREKRESSKNRSS